MGKFTRTKNSMSQKKYVAMSVAAFFACWLWTGLLVVEDFEDEGYRAFFIKTRPTFLFVFKNPYAFGIPDEEAAHRESVAADGVRRPNTVAFSDFSRYCRFRYNIENIETQSAMNECRTSSKKDSQNKYKIHFQF